MKTDDPAIAEIREVRHRISKSVGHDPQKLVAHYMEMQKKHEDRLLKQEEQEPAEPVKI